MNEWEIVADDYRVERAGYGQMATLYPVAPRTLQRLPTECSACINVGDVSVSVRNVFDPDRIAFRLTVVLLGWVVVIPKDDAVVSFLLDQFFYTTSWDST